MGSQSEDLETRGGRVCTVSPFFLIILMMGSCWELRVKLEFKRLLDTEPGSWSLPKSVNTEVWFYSRASVIFPGAPNKWWRHICFSCWCHFTPMEQNEEEPRAKTWKWGGMKREPAGTSEENWPVRTERMKLFLEHHRAWWAETPFLSVLASDRILSRKPGYTHIVLQACTTDVWWPPHAARKGKGLIGKHWTLWPRVSAPLTF